MPIGPLVQSTRPLEGLTPVVAVALFGDAQKGGYEVCARKDSLVQRGKDWRSYGQRLTNVRRFK